MDEAIDGSSERPAWAMPFDSGQWQAVVDSLPPEPGQEILREIVRVVRKYLTDTELDEYRERLRGGAKGDAHSEVAQLREQIVSLIVSIERMNPAAREYLDKVRLSSHPRTLLEELQDHLGEVLSAYRLRTWLPDPALAENRGRPVETVRLAEVRESLSRIFKQAHGGTERHRGFPAFLFACIAPLGLPKHLRPAGTSYEDLDADEKISFHRTWSDIRRAASRREKVAAKRRRKRLAA
jgi:hypothetical protein